MQDAKEEVRARLNIEDVIAEYVQLKRAGRNFKGLSPFTSERTPSFVVSPEKHIWHDFSSGKGGDVFSFVMEVEGVDFRQALEQLARRAGVDLSMYATKRSGEVAKKKKVLLEISEWAAKYYQQSLLRNKHALEYVFQKRGLSKEIVTSFRVGYAPDEGQTLIALLRKKGYAEKDIREAGLTNRFGGDIFRGRMTIPLMDGVGQVIGFTGRTIIDDPKSPKYLNTPQTLLYDKSRHVFGLSQAKESIRKHDASVIVEGNMDVISSHQAGVTQVVATAGTALTEWHLKALVRLSPQVKLAFDADKAGLAATERAIPIAQDVGVELAIVTLPGEAKDPDELIQQDVALWQQAIAQTSPVVDWVIAQHAARVDLGSALGKRQFTSVALAVAGQIVDPVEREHYLKKIADMTDVSLEAVLRKLDRAADEGKSLKPIKTSDHTSQAEPEQKNDPQQDIVLGLLIKHPSTRQYLETADDGLFDGTERQILATYLKTHPTALLDTLPRALHEIETYVKIVELKAETRYEGWLEQDIALEAARLLRQIKLEHKKQQKVALTSELRDAEEAGDDTRADALRQQLHTLIKETSHG